MKEDDLFWALVGIAAIGATLGAAGVILSHKVSSWYYTKKWDRVWRSETNGDAKR